MSFANELTIEEKRIMVDIIDRLRGMSIVGLIEARDWIELLFPEFAEVRDQESDALFLRLALLQGGKDTEDVHQSE